MDLASTGVTGTLFGAIFVDADNNIQGCVNRLRKKIP